MLQGKKILICFFSLLLFTVQTAFAFSLWDEQTQQVIKETWDVQTISQLQNGIVAVPEAAINDYISGILPVYPDIQTAHVVVNANNKLNVTIESKKTGHIAMQGTITKFVQNQDESVMCLSIDNKKIIGKPVTSWFFSRMSLGMLTKLFGNPLNGNEEYYTVQVDKNILTVDFKAFIDHSPLNNVSLLDYSLLQLISVDDVTTNAGTVYLHTSLHGPQKLLVFINSLFA